jgi:hypothetical protein
MASSKKWLDRTQPQTLVMATIILYINAALGLLTGLGGGSIFALLLLVSVGAAFGIANEKKWGYWLAVVLTAFDLLLTIAAFSGTALLNLLFYGALLALLLHPQSREYRRTWFRW